MKRGQPISNVAFFCRVIYAPLRWWDPDDGWKIGTLCRSCAHEFMPCEPKQGDYAFRATNGVCDECNTDEDPIDAL